MKTTPANKSNIKVTKLEEQKHVNQQQKQKKKH